MSPDREFVVGVGVILLSPQKHVIPCAFSLMESCSNNAVEYNTLLIGLEVTRKVGTWILVAYGDSMPIVSQVRRSMKFDVKI